MAADAEGRRRLALRYAEQCIQSLLQDLQPSALLGASMDISASTMFSGMTTAECALDMLSAVTGGRVQHVSACDTDRAARKTLLDTVGHGCLHVDVADYITNTSKAPKVFNMDGRLQGQIQRWMETVHPTKISPWCCRHAAACKMQRSDVVVLGSPCTDWSSYGSGKGLEGDTCVPTLASLRVCREALVVIHENVVQFPHDIFVAGMGDQFRVFTIKTAPADVGFPCVRRPRIYRIAVRKDIELLADPSALFMRLKRFFKLNRTLSLSDCLFSSAVPPLDVKKLTRKQQGYLKLYKKKWQVGVESLFFWLVAIGWLVEAKHGKFTKAKPGVFPAVFHLGDNPANRCVMSNGGQDLSGPAIALAVIYARGAWLSVAGSTTFYACLLLHYFPVFQTALEVLRVACFCRSGERA
jgi:site-specific DNA-cytosine methylase